MAKGDTPAPTAAKFDVRVIQTQLAPGPDGDVEVCQVSAICPTVQIGFLVVPEQSPTCGDEFEITIRKKPKGGLVVAPAGSVPGA